MAVTLVKPTVAPVAPVEEAVDADQLGNDILLAAAAGETVTYVPGGRDWQQSHSARAWTRSGNVD